MNIFLNRDGSCQKVSPERIYQGSANVNSITVVAPFDDNTALAIAFSLPNCTRTQYMPMSFSPLNQPGASEGVFFWSYVIPRAVTEIPGIVGVSLNAVSATGNQTSYQCTFVVEASIVPVPPSEPDNDTWEALLVLYQQNATAISALERGRVPVGEVTTVTLQPGNDADVDIEWNAENSALDYNFKIPKGDPGEAIRIMDGVFSADNPLPPFGSTNPGEGYVFRDANGRYDLYIHSVDNLDWVVIEDWGGIRGTSIRFLEAWSAAINYKNDTEFIDTVTYEGALYICLASHTSSATPPPEAPTLWKVAANGVVSAVAVGMDIAVTFADGSTSTIKLEGGIADTVELTIDEIPTQDSTNLVSSGGVYDRCFARTYRQTLELAPDDLPTITPLELCTRMENNSVLMASESNFEAPLLIPTDAPGNGGVLQVINTDNNACSFEFTTKTTGLTTDLRRWIGFVRKSNSTWSGWRRVELEPAGVKQENRTYVTITISGTSFNLYLAAATYAHTYPAAGTYQIEISGTGTSAVCKWGDDTSETVDFTGGFKVNNQTDKDAYREIILGTNCTAIGNFAFWGCSNLASATLGGNGTYIGQSAFNGCTSLSSIIIPNGVTSVQNGAFSGCTKLVSINIPSSVTSLGTSAFVGCTSLISVTIPDSVTSIGHWAFVGCTSLISVTIPDSLTSIGNYAFSGCASLRVIDFRQNTTLPTIGTDTFENCRISDIIALSSTLADSAATAITTAGGTLMTNYRKLY